MNVNLSTCRIALYINVPNWGWASKPYLNDPYTSIASDGTWAAYYATGGNDVNATEIIAFLLPSSYNAPVFEQRSSLPRELFDNCAAYVQVAR
ncbi:MAG TPA: hypothetical protein DCZ95_11510 [Verrucomicrobia bacterium]|nr:hypothetical protein [Verrucomicrobiota bacterium]